MGSANLLYSPDILRRINPKIFPSPYPSTGPSLLQSGAPAPLRPSVLRFPPGKCHSSISPVNSLPPSDPNISEEEEGEIPGLAVPDSWLVPSQALEESEWLRVSLHKWLDDEYCPEETNIEISKVAAASYHRSLLEKRTDLGEILLKMAQDLSSISYRDSFHGAFSSANAAVDLIARRIGPL